MSQTQKTVVVTWRDEGYGRVSENSVAFRASPEPFPSETGRRKLASAYKRAGFTANESRAAWIAEHKPGDTPLKLIAEIEKLGYTVQHEGRVPAIVRATVVVEDEPEEFVPKM